MLEDFLPRFNNRFKVPAREQEVAYRAVDDGMRLDRVLCFKYRRRVARDNTVRYRWRTLQLLPGTDRPTYAGAAVDVLEGLDDSLAVQHEGRDIPSQEAPPRPSVLRGFAGRTTHSPIIHQSTNGLGSKWIARLATPDTNHDAEQPVTTSGRNGTRRVSQNCDSNAQEAHAVAHGQMEGGAEGEAQGTVHTWDRPGAEHTQKHLEEVHGRRKPTYCARAPDVNDIVVWYYGKLHQWTESLRT